MAEPRAERKLVTLLFADLSGYTALAASLDPEEVYSLIRPTMVELQRVVEDHGGTVPQIQGDGFMALFGVPTTHEDDAERAVRAALAVRTRVRELNEGRSGLSIPEVHSGINSGEVMVGPSSEASGFAVVGDVVNTASRLADLAPAGKILVEEQTWRRTNHAIRYGRRRLYRAKGKPEPVAAYEARAVRTSSPTGRATPLVGAEFVDREAQLERLSSEFRGARKDRSARVVIVSAEPGTGKTRLASEFIKRVPDALVLAGRATAYGTQVALSPLAAAIGEIAGIPPGSSASVGRRRVQALARRVSVGDSRHLTRGLSLLLGIGGGPDGRGSRGTQDAIDAARTVLEGLARERPVVVLLDDLQWADPAVVAALGTVRSQRWSGPLLIIGLTRMESLHRLRGLTRIQLDALPDDAMGELAVLAVGQKALTPALRRVVNRAGGNPLYLEESLSMLMEAGALVSTSSGWQVVDPEMLDRVPTTVRAIIAARLDGLPHDEKRVLQCASVSGELTWDRLLRRLAPGVDVSKVVRGLVSRDLLRRRRGSQAKGSTEYVFKHALIRDVAYGSLPRRERAHLHVQVAGWLREDAGLAREPVDELAHHYAEAWRLSRSDASLPPEGLARLTATYVGRWADETLAYQAVQAEALYRRALEVGDSAPDEVGPALQARHTLGRAECLIDLGRHPEAREAASEAKELADRLGDDQLGARALVTLGRVESDVGDDDLARDLLQRALSYFGSVGDVPGQAWATHRLSEISLRTDYGVGLEHLRTAHRLFVEAGDRWGQVIAAQDLAYMLSTVGGPEFHHWYREAKRLVEGEGDLRSRAALLRTLGYYRYYCGEYEEAVEVMRRARPLAIAAGDRYAEVDTLLIEALAAAADRSPKEAELASAQAVVCGREIGSVRVQALARAAGTRAALRSGDPRGAGRSLGISRRALERLGARTEMLEAELIAAELLLDRGAWSRVRAPAEAGALAARVSGEHLIEPVGVLLIGRAALGSGEAEAAVEILREAGTLARRAGATGTLAVARAARDQAVLLSGRIPRPRRGSSGGVVARAIEAENRGLLSLAHGAEADALTSLHEAVESWEVLGSTVWLARALAMRGAAMRRAGDGRRAAAALARARRVLDRLETPGPSRGAILAPITAEFDERRGAPGSRPR